MPKISSKLIIIAIIIAGFFIYSASLPNGFAWDDEEQIVNNAVIRNLGNIPQLFSSSTFNAGGAGLSGGFYRPIVSLFNLLNYQIWGINSFGFHFVQLLFHLANSVLIFFLIRKILTFFQVKYAIAVAGISALLFVAHPANVESVAYSGSIGEVLYTFFLLLALWFLAKNESSSSGVGLPMISRSLTPIFLFIFLGLLSKETAIIAFPILALYLLIFKKPNLKYWLAYIAGSSITLGLYLFLRFFLAKIPAVSSHFAPISQASFLQRLFTIPYEIVTYLKIIFFPKDLFIYRHFVVSSPADPKFWGSAIFLSLLFFGIFYLIFKAKCKLGLFFVFWAILGIAPALNIIPLEMSATERWLYFPMIGILASLSLLFVWLTQKFPLKITKISAIFLILAILLLGARTISRASDWKNGLTLFSKDAKYSLNSFDLENNLGVELFRTGKIDEAGLHFKKSIELQPNWTYSHNNLGVALERKGDFLSALAEYEKAIELSDYYLAYENLGGLLFKIQKYEKAKDFLLKSLLKFPRNANLKTQLALVYLTENDLQKARSLLFQALQDDPANENALQILNVMQDGTKIEFQN